jgi:hypothetical protein
MASCQEESLVSFCQSRMTWEWRHWECSQACTEQTGCSIDTRLKKHHWCVWLEHPAKSAMAEQDQFGTLHPAI